MMARINIPSLASLASLALSGGLILLLLAPAPAQSSQDLVIDLSKSVVEISTGFSGSDLLLFGVKNGPGDLIVVIKGPIGTEVVRRKERVAGVWINTEEMGFTGVPSFYAIASSRPLETFLDDQAARENQIGADYINLQPKNNDAAPRAVAEYRKALIRNKRRLGLYASQAEKISFIGNQLFRTYLRFPANVPVGSYDIKTYLVRDGKINTVDSSRLKVEKIGAEAAIYSFAHRHSLAYGVLAVLIAVVTGWLASVFFRKA